MADSNPALYRWKRWSAPKPVNSGNTSKSKKLTGADDIQDWIKKVQEASDRAAAVTFGHKYTGGSHGNGMATAMATVDALHDHDEAYQEAQELLNQWMTDKCHLDNDFDDDMDEILSSRNPPTRSEIKKQWDDLIAVEDPGFPHPYNGISSEAFVKEIEERDEESTVEGIIQGLLDKPVVETDFLRDLGLDERKKKGKDPTISMQARHQRVKENREKRQKERERELREKQRRNDAQLQAQQIILKEERDKAMHKRKEETLLQQEMTKIRKEMEEHRRVAEEVQRREQERWEAEKRREREERDLQQRKAELRKHQAQQMLEEERKELTRRLEEMKAKKATEDLKCLRRHFSAWYQLVANRRIQMGKARALSDWRRLVRAWNKWRHYVRQQRMEYEERQTEFYIRESHRKKQLAEDFHRKTLLKRYFVSWQLWVAQEQQSREMTERRQETKNKMAAFLEAAASGKLWTNRKEDDSLLVDDLETPHSNRSSDRPDSSRQKVDNLFDQPARRLQNHSVPSTGRSDWSLQDTQSRKPKPLEKPKFAWQVTRKHVNLTPEQLANRGDGEQNNAAEYDYENVQREMDMGRSRKIPYTINNFEHRYAAQQKILQEQQKQLKEQQRLIVEMQSMQRQQLLQQELNNLQDGSSTSKKPSNVKDINNAVSDVSQPLSSRSQSSDTAVTTHSDSSNESSNVTLNEAKKTSKASTNFLKGMEERAARIAQRKAEADERRRKREAERLAQIKEAEEKRRLEEEAEKKAKIERVREERRLAKQKEEEKQERLDQIKRQNSKADEHYRQTLLRNKGLAPWLRLVQISRHNMQIAIDYHNMVLIQKCFTPWKEITQDTVQEKQRLADEMYNNILVRRALASWRRYGHLQSIQLQKARRHYSYTTKVKYFKLWQDYTTERGLSMMRKEELAAEHNQYRIMKRAYSAWRRYPQVVKEEERRQKRMEEMRKKVQSILPDFGVS